MAINIVTTNMADQFAHWGSDADIGDLASGTNAEVAVHFIAAGATLHHVVEGVAWSYSAAPAGGNLLVEDGTTAILNIDITAAGHGYIPIRKRGSANATFTITLTAGGAGIVGRVNAIGHRLD